MPTYLIALVSHSVLHDLVTVSLHVYMSRTYDRAGRWMLVHHDAGTLLLVHLLPHLRLWVVDTHSGVQATCIGRVMKTSTACCVTQVTQGQQSVAQDMLLLWRRRLGLLRAPLMKHCWLQLPPAAAVAAPAPVVASCHQTLHPHCS